MQLFATRLFAKHSARLVFCTKLRIEKTNRPVCLRFGPGTKRNQRPASFEIKSLETESNYIINIG